MKKAIAFISITIIFLSVFSVSAFAYGTGKSYTYNHFGEAVPTPDPYVVDKVVGAGLGLNKPEDSIYHNGFLYILDSGNLRVVVLDKNFNYVRQIKFKKNGLDYQLVEPMGIWIDENDNMYIADRSKGVVIKSDLNGNVQKEYGRPKTDLIDSKSDYLPLKVLTDKNGIIYILVENEYRGIVTIDQDGNFMGFFGSNKVQVTSQLLLDQFWENFMTQAQISRTQRYLPVDYSSMAIDSNDFVYTACGTTSDMTELIRKINPLSTNVLENQGVFGDSNLGVSRGIWYFTDFNAITTDNDGFITVLDKTWDRIFQYSSEGKLLYIFGGEGDQAGTFSQPVDIESIGDELVILDKDYGNLTVMKPTAFGENVRKAENLYQDGRFTESIGPWNEVIKEDSNYEFAYEGIGESLFVSKKYQEAMKDFKLANSHADYSLAFQRFRSQFLRNNFTLFITILLLLFVVLPFIYRKLRKRNIYGKDKLLSIMLIAIKLLSIGRFLMVSKLLIKPERGGIEL